MYCRVIQYIFFFLKDTWDVCVCVCIFIISPVGCFEGELRYQMDLGRGDWH